MNVTVPAGRSPGTGTRLVQVPKSIIVRVSDQGGTMDQLATYEYALEELRRTVTTLGDAHMDAVTNCDPWTVRRLASHALNNQLLWGGLVTGQQLVSMEDTMGAVPYEGDLAAFADDVAARATAMWSTTGVLEAMHTTPFGTLPGSVDRPEARWTAE
jgi:hypothetical protein